MVERGRFRLNLLKQPGWLRGLEIVTGILTIVFGVLVLVYPGWAIETLILLLSIGLFFAGIRAIALVGVSSLSVGLRALSVMTGIICLISSVVVVLSPGYGVATLLAFVSFGLMVYGFGRIFLGSALKETPAWIRGMSVVVGVLDVILSVAVLLLPIVALLTLAVILSMVLVVSGVETIISGAIGRTWLGDLVKAATD
jgi:uncharacterized membrane protein HdeD (DUF308 family)